MQDAGWLDKTRRPIYAGDEVGFPLTCSEPPPEDQQPGAPFFPVSVSLRLGASPPPRASSPLRALVVSTAFLREAAAAGVARLELQSLEENTQFLERKPAEAMRAAAARILNDSGAPGARWTSQGLPPLLRTRHGDHLLS